MSGFINIAINAAYEAGNIIQQASNNLQSIRIKQKGVHNFVTEVDQRAEDIIVKIIKNAFPSHNIIAEESNSLAQNSDYTWIIDPLDGTNNFIHGNPNYSISIAVKHNNDIIAGVVFDPNRNNLYKAELGRGAYLNDKRIRVSGISLLEYALIGTGYPYASVEYLDKYLATLKELSIASCGQRRIGSAALDLAYVASGVVDGFWEHNLKIWDIAAGVLLVKEAGGMVCDFNQQHNYLESGNIVAANPKILPQLFKIIKKHV